MIPEKKDKHNIIFITPWYPTLDKPSHGIFIREHAKAVRLYDDVEVIHIASRDPAQTKFIRISLENNHLLTEGIKTFRYTNKGLFIPSITIVNEIIGAYQCIKLICKSGMKPDLIHAHILRAGFDAIIIGRLLKCPVIITEQNSAFPRKILTQTDLFKAKYALPRADMVLPVSKALQKGIEDYKIHAKFRIIPNVVDTSLFFPDLSYTRNNSKINIIFVGSLVPVKGVNYLLHALAGIQSQYRCHLDIIGTGPHESEYKQLCSELGLGNLVSFHGYKPKNVIAEMMRYSDIFVLPSLYETMGCVLIEAMASGLPIISTKIGGIPEIVDEESGVLCQPGDIESLQSSIGNVIDKLATYNKKNLSLKASRFSHDVIGHQLHDIYNEVLAEYHFY